MDYPKHRFFLFDLSLLFCITGNGLNFAVDNNLAFEIPLNNVSHTTTAKNEVTLEFHQNDDAAVSLIELRFHIPTDQNNPENDTVQVGTGIFFRYNF